MQLYSPIHSYRFYLLAFFLLAGGFLFAHNVQAASIYSSPNQGAYDVGDSFAVSVFVSSSDQSVNAVSGVLDFPADKLQVTSVSKTGSVLNLWVQEPSFSNSAGTVNFEGIILNPGYTGSAGKVIVVNFRAKAAGKANITFLSGSVLANDGKGTNVLEGLGSSSFSIDAVVTGPVAEESTSPPAVVTAGTLPAPQIKSITHPDPNAWYVVNIPQFSWDLPAGTTGVRLLVDQKPQSNPSVLYSPPISEKTLEKLDDGIYYFHVQLRNANGWGGVTHFRFQIDAQPPDPFVIEFLDGTDNSDNPRPIIRVQHSDTMSGTEGYSDIKIDDGEWFPSNYDSGSELFNEPHTFRLPPQTPGPHTLVVKVSDQAGNSTVAVGEFTIIPLDTPVIDEYPRQLVSGDPFIVTGLTYPNSTVTIWLQKDSDEPFSTTVHSDAVGKFTLIYQGQLSDGIYQMRAEVIDEREAHSNKSEAYTFLVSPTRLWQLGNKTMDILSIIIPVIAMIFALVFGSWFSLHKLRRFRAQLRHETTEAQKAMHREFVFLKKRLKSHVASIERTGKKRKLTKAESNLVNKLKKDLTEVEFRIEAEINDIEKDLK